MLFATHEIFLDFQDIAACLLLLLIKKMINPPCDKAFLKFTNAAPLKHNILRRSIFSSFPLFAIAGSLIFASATDTLISHAPKLMSDLVWLDVKFSFPARPLYD